jgi:VanZ family protein
MTTPSHSQNSFVIWFWVYGMVLVVATHAPAKDVQFLARAVDYGLLDPDKLLHLTAYSVLGLLAVLAYGNRWRKPSSAVVWLFPLLTVWGMLDEWTQPFFGRLADGSDLIYDIVGIGIGLTAGIFASRWLRRPELP